MRATVLGKKLKFINIKAEICLAHAYDAQWNKITRTD